MSDAQADTGIKHARQLGRCISRLEAMAENADGNEAIVLEDALAALRARAVRISHVVDPPDIDRLTTEDYRSLAVFADGAVRHLEPEDALAVERAGALAADHVEAMDHE